MNAQELAKFQMNKQIKQLKKNMVRITKLCDDKQLVALTQYNNFCPVCGTANIKFDDKWTCIHGHSWVSLIMEVVD